MGQPKPFLPFQRTTFLAAIAGVLRESGIADIVVVANPAHESLYRERPLSGIRLTWNPRVDEGMMSSLVIGLREMRPEASHALVCPVDIPGVSEETVRLVAEACRTFPDRITVATRGGRRAHPVAFPRWAFRELETWTGPGGAAGFIREHQAEVQLVEAEASDCLDDVDTPEDFRRLAEGDYGR
ncbi:nucleotidyltransferase family protein [Candidatus Poribacteria bacterium]|nr:nucleotidyltransferase family protein [Candidatus Poribacteria bacterium]